MIIGITQRVITNESYYEVRDALSHDWIQYLGTVFDKPVIVPIPNLVADMEYYLAESDFDLVILSNGNDVGTCEIRDNAEKIIYKYCIDKNVKLLGACRGFQFIGFMHGCKITTDLALETGKNHVAKNHDVEIVSEKFMDYFDINKLTVNSYHNQGIMFKNVPNTLQTFAISDKNIVEGFYSVKHAILGIQWHPERKNDSTDFDAKLIRKFAISGNFWNE